MKFLDIIIKLSMIIFELIQKLSFSIGNRIINNLEELDIPVMEILNKHLNFSTKILKSTVGALGILLGIWMIKSIKKHIIKASYAAKRMKYRMSSPHYGGSSHYGASSHYNESSHGMSNHHPGHDWNKHHHDYNQQLIFNQMQNAHLSANEQMMSDHQAFIDNMNQESFMNDSLNNCMEDAFNAATPCDFGGDSQSIFESSFDHDLQHDFDHSFDHDFDSFDHDFGSFDHDFDHGCNHDFGGFNDF